MRLPHGHWLALDWLVSERFIERHRIVAIAWNGWIIDRQHGFETTFETALGVAIQEADIQYESWTNGFTNDNP